LKTAPIQPACIVFGAEGGPPEPPLAPDFGDLYHPRIGALEQAQHVFLRGNGLPERWCGRRDFTILELGFGLGNNFLATWQAWRGDAARCERLHVVSVELHPPRHADLARAHADAQAPLSALAAPLLQAWPPLAPGLHRLAFDGGRVLLTLALGDAAMLLPQLHLHADAVFLDGFAPARNPQLWQPALMKAVARRCAPGATAATWSVARGLHEALTSAGFEVQHSPGIGGKREITRAVLAPRFAMAQRPPPADERRAVVVGAGIAGAAAAQALARHGFAVTVLEAAATAAAGASGNRAGLFHGTLDPDDSPYARLHRAAALWAAASYRDAIDNAAVPGQVQGLLRLAPARQGRTDPRQLAAQCGLPAEYVQLLDAEEASRRAGVPLSDACWFYPGGGWLSPAHWVRHVLHSPGVSCLTDAAVDGVERGGSGWLLRGTDGRVLAEAPVLVVAAAAHTSRLLLALGQEPLPLRSTRGQITELQHVDHPLRLPLAGDGYAIPLDGHTLLCGATRQGGDDDPALRDADQQHNLGRLHRLTGIEPQTPHPPLHGRVAWRLHSDDRLPVAGAVPLPVQPAGRRLDQARLLAREPGLFVLTALGARGITWAPLLAEVVAARAAGAPAPLEQDLADAIDPARWLVRRARAAAG
jgi:tRNA 5-methylaminomethyl-2-thiouridine biosynthesis bifunctional protein